MDIITAALAASMSGGGGGGTGTDDYNELSNKPKINGVTLAGNKSLADIGAAAASETYTDTEVDALLSEKADADDVYTKAQTDAELAKKVDKETGKGLSTNDFTNADKENLATALEKANAAAPQATTYTKGEVDAALAEKLDAADIDDALSSTSTNPVQNRVVQAPIARLVDDGAKNLATIETSTPHVSNGITFMASNGLINASGTASDSADASFVVFEGKTLKPGSYCVSGCPSGGAIGKYRIDLVVDSNVYRDVGSNVSFTVTSNANAKMQIVVYRGNSVNDLTFSPMLCTAEDYAISPEFVPYAPSNRELYKMVLALQNAQNGD